MNINDKKLALLNSYIENTEYNNNFIDKINEIFENPIFVFDPSFRLYLTTYKNKLTESKWFNKFNNSYMLSIESIEEVVKGRILEELDNTQDAIEYRSKSLPKAAMIKKVIDGRNELGFVVLYANNREFIKEDKELLELAANVMIRDIKTRGLDRNFNQVVFSNILDGKYETKDELKEVLENIHINIEGSIRTMVVKTDKSKILVEYLLNKNNDIYSFIYKDKVVSLIYGDRDKNNTIIDSLIKEIGKEDYAIGISSEFDDLNKLSKYYKQALDTIEISNKYNTNNKVNYYEDNKMLSFITKLDKEDLSNLVDTRVKEIIEYDKKHKTKYSDDIKVYFSSGRNIGKAAQLLYIHKNSMYYRLEKIKELFEIDFENEEDCFNIENAKIEM